MSEQALAFGEITEDDISEAEGYDALGPSYFAARRTAERFMKPFTEQHFQPLVDEFVSQFKDRLWSDIADFLISDTESNIQSAIWRAIDGTVDALLTGKEWAMRRYPYAHYARGAEIREAVAKHAGDGLLTQRIAELEVQLKKANEHAEWLRAR